MSASEAVKMETLLDWILKGKRVNLQPDSTSANALRLVLLNPGKVANVLPWTTLDRVSYGSFTFKQELSRT